MIAAGSAARQSTPWVCSRCLKQQASYIQQQQRRFNLHPLGFKASHSPSVRSRCRQNYQSQNRLSLPQCARYATATQLKPSTGNSAYIDHTDDALRRIFDSREFWKDFSSHHSSAASGKRAGLLQNKFLTSPEGFDEFTQDSLARCQRLVDRALSASSVEDYKNLVIVLDRLSDQLCRVIDIVEFLRNVHPDPRIQQAATNAHSFMFEYMNMLNTEPGLCLQLKKALDSPETVASLSEEERVTAEKLLLDFQHSAIDRPAAERQKVIQLSNTILALGTDVNNHMRPEKLSLAVSSSRLKGMSPTKAKQMFKWGPSNIPTYGGMATHALQNVHDEQFRKELYIANRRASDESVGRVEDLARNRYELARLAGFDSFGHMTLSDKMAKTPEAVEQFLDALASSNKPHLTRDLQQLSKLKQADFPTGSKDIQAWDRQYYTRKARAEYEDNTGYSDPLSAYFSVGNVMQGLSRLFDRLFGIRLVPREPLPGETWHEDVRRLDVVDEQEGLIAVLYCDLFRRPDKFANAAHFTLRCSRDIGPAEIQEYSASLPPLSSSSLQGLADTVNDGMALKRHPTDPSKVQQLPTVAFVCDFAQNPASEAPTLLSFSQVSTLFHEMGHAVHSMLGRTALQNVAGTRCATDFAELPSILMEHFASSPAVLGLFARHHRTNEPLDPGRLQRHLQKAIRFSSSQELEGQILLSVLDQRFHTSLPPAWDSTATYQSVFNDPRFASVPEPAETAWHGFFGHLVGYGAVYYSYLFDRAIAGRVFSSVFADGGKVLDRAAGQHYRDAVLKWGGARDGWRCLADVLGPETQWISEGGEAAMRQVGRWGADAATQATSITM